MVTERFPRLRYRSEHGRCEVSDAVVVQFYMRCSHAEASGAVARALDLFRETVGPRGLVQYDDSVDPDPELKPLDERAWTSIRQRVLEPRPAYGLEMGDEQWDAAGCGVRFRGMWQRTPEVHFPANAVTWLFFRLPTEFLEEQGAPRVRALAEALARELPFDSGFANLALCETYALGTHDTVLRLRARYLGMHMHHDGCYQFMGTQINGVHWLNFLGQPVLGQLGGAAGLRERLCEPGLSVQELSGDKVLVVLGEAPDVGDIQAGRSLPLHSALARVLEPHLYHETVHTPFRSDPDGSLRWERRFLD